MVVLCVLVAVALIADAAFLMSRHVFSLGVTLPLAIGCALLLLASRWTAVQRWIRAKPWRHRAWRWGWFAC